VLAIAPVAVINITSVDDTQTPMMMAFISRPLAEPVGDNRIAEPIGDDRIIDASGADDKATAALAAMLAQLGGADPRVK
jgi:hypothetical protein